MYSSLPEAMVMLILRGGIIDFNRSCEQAQILERNLKRYPIELFPSDFQNTELGLDSFVELLKNEIVNQIRDLCFEMMFLHYTMNNQNGVQTNKWIGIMCKPQISLKPRRTWMPVNPIIHSVMKIPQPTHL